jgi:hypothetical protein
MLGAVPAGGGTRPGAGARGQVPGHEARCRGTRPGAEARGQVLRHEARCRGTRPGAEARGQVPVD